MKERDRLIQIKICMRGHKEWLLFFFFFFYFTCSYQFRENHKVSFVPEEDYECNHTLNSLFSIFGRPLTCEQKSDDLRICGRKKNNNISSGVLLRSSPMTSLAAGCFKAERERQREKGRKKQKKNNKKKTLDNHQCLQYLSSKRLKAHIAYNWIWFALPASVREIKGKHKNPHDSFSSTWQARPNRSWKEYLWRKPSRLLAQRLLEMTVLGNNEHIIKKKKKKKEKT